MALFRRYHFVFDIIRRLLQMNPLSLQEKSDDSTQSFAATYSFDFPYTTEYIVEMGGCPSLSWNARKIEPHFQAFSPSSNGTSGALSALDECLLLIFKHVGREKALQSIFQNSTALPTFIKYMSLKGADKVEALLKRAIRASVDRNTILQQCSSEQYHSDAAINMLDEMDPQCCAIFDVMCEMLPSYLQSDFYQEWRYRERLEACQALLQVQIPETTLPELSFNPQFSELATAEANPFNNIKAIVSSVESVITISDSCCKVRKDSLDVDSHIIPSATLSFHDSFTISNLYNSSSLYQALEHCDPIESSKLLHSKSWLPIFLAMAETLPIGVSLSRVQADHNDFPYERSLIKLRGSQLLARYFLPQLSLVRYLFDNLLNLGVTSGGRLGPKRLNLRAKIIKQYAVSGYKLQCIHCLRNSRRNYTYETTEYKCPPERDESTVVLTSTSTDSIARRTNSNASDYYYCEKKSGSTLAAKLQCGGSHSETFISPVLDTDLVTSAYMYRFPTNIRGHETNYNLKMRHRKYGKAAKRFCQKMSQGTNNLNTNTTATIYITQTETLTSLNIAATQHTNQRTDNVMLRLWIPAE
eukprot:gene9172-19004_t